MEASPWSERVLWLAVKRYHQCHIMLCIAILILSNGLVVLCNSSQCFINTTLFLQATSI